MFGLPKYASYSTIEDAVEIYLQHYINDEDLRKSQTEKKPYYVKIMETQKAKCLFCGMPEGKIESAENVEPCCQVLERDIPLIWVSKERQYSIYVDWVDMKRYDHETLSVIEIDTLSLAA